MQDITLRSHLLSFVFESNFLKYFLTILHITQFTCLSVCLFVCFVVSRFSSSFTNNTKNLLNEFNK